MVSLPKTQVNDVIRRASDGSDTEEHQRFLQLRVTMFVRALLILFGATYFGGAVLIALLVPDYFVTIHAHPGKILNLLMFVVSLAVFVYVRAGRRSTSALRAVDLGMVLFTTGSAAVGVATAPPGYFIELGGLLFFVLVMIFRAALVPSTAQFTALAGLTSTVMLVAGSYFQGTQSDWGGFLTPVFVASAVCVWCLAITAGAAMVSREIYGLVAQVRRAMQLGRYTLREKIGEGGMGAVYRAEHAMLRRATAIKLLLPDRVSPEALIRFEREVQLTSQLSHPNTIAIHDYGRTSQGVFYYAMEFLTGKSLDSLVENEGPQPPARVVHMLLQVAGSLREAHAAGLIHRDIKPANLLIGDHGGLRDFVKVIDFGLVKQLDSGAGPAVTRTDSIAGTPFFMAPECISRPESIDAKVDTYALGATAYFLVAGVPVFEGRSMVEVCGHHMHSTPVPPSQRLGRAIPVKLEALILRCLAKEPERRPNDDELWNALRECERESPWDALSEQPGAASARAN